ncbi:MAG: TonB-dependent receptor plug domain-containing protein [Butyricimonas faecihominis]
MYVIDGVLMQAFTSSVTGANTLSDLDPSMIESIEVLKDAASLPFMVLVQATALFLLQQRKGSGKAVQCKCVLPASCCRKLQNSQEDDTKIVFLNALRNTVAPYKTASGEWKVPVSYEEVFVNKGTNGPIYNWFWGKTGPHDAWRYKIV